MATCIKSISLSLEMNALCEKYKISLTEAARIGVSVILSEIGEDQFLNKTNIGRKVLNMAKIISEFQQKLEGYENVLEKKN